MPDIKSAAIISKRKRLILAALMTTLLLGGLVWLLSSLLKPVETGLVRVSVRDGATDAPVSGACVIIPETGGVYYTGESGETPIMELPVLYDKHYGSMLEQDYGLITILVYCEGYAPYALYFAHVEPGALRQGPNVWLFPGEGDPFCIIEGPDTDWTREFIEEFEP